MAAKVEHWDASGIEVVLGAPGAITGLNNPVDWSEIRSDAIDVFAGGMLPNSGLQLTGRLVTALT